MAKQLKISEQIERSPQEVHDWLNDWDHIRSWMGPSLISIDILSDHGDQEPLCKGMRFRETRQMGKMKAKAIITVEQHETNDGVFVHQAVFDDGCNRMTAHYEYVPTSIGCEVTWTMVNSPNKWWTKIISVVSGPLMIKMLLKCEADHLKKLKELIESSDTALEQTS